MNSVVVGELGGGEVLRPSKCKQPWMLHREKMSKVVSEIIMLSFLNAGCGKIPGEYESVR